MEGLNIEENKHHLIWDGKQSIDVMRHMLTREEFLGFLKGQVLKYQLRLGKKDDYKQDLKKIDDYTKQLNKELKNK